MIIGNSSRFFFGKSGLHFQRGITEILGETKDCSKNMNTSSTDCFVVCFQGEEERNRFRVCFVIDNIVNGLTFINRTDADISHHNSGDSVHIVLQQNSRSY